MRPLSQVWRTQDQLLDSACSLCKKSWVCGAARSVLVCPHLSVTAVFLREGGFPGISFSPCQAWPWGLSWRVSESQGSLSTGTEHPDSAHQAACVCLGSGHSWCAICADPLQVVGDHPGGQGSTFNLKLTVPIPSQLLGHQPEFLLGPSSLKPRA